MAKRKSEKAKSYTLSSILCIVFAALLIASAFIPFISTTSSSELFDSSSTEYANGFDIFKSIFSDNKDSVEAFESIFGSNELLNLNRIAGLSAIAAVGLGALAVVCALLALLLKSKLFKNINVLLGILSLLIGVVAIIAGFMIAGKSGSLDLGALAKVKVSIAFAPFTMLVGGLGLTCGAVLRK